MILFSGLLILFPGFVILFSVFAFLFSGFVFMFSIFCVSVLGLCLRCDCFVFVFCILFFCFN